jgi:glycosyltransferase involved in cell wall biosynthesis
LEEYKVLIVVPSLRGGGAERVMLNLAEHLSSQAFNVKFLVISSKDHQFFSPKENLEVCFLGKNKVIYSIFSYRKFLKENEPYILISSLTHLNVISVFVNMLSGFRGKIILVEHNKFSFKILSKTSWTDRFAKLLAFFAYRLSDCVVCVSKGVQESVVRSIKINRNMTRVINNPVLENFKRNYQIDCCDADPGRKRVFKILAIGRLVEAKNFPLLIEVLAEINKDIECELTILGDGPMRDCLLRLAQKLNISHRLNLPGFVADTENYFLDANVFVLSSNWEGLPTVLIEALDYGLPVVACDCDYGPREILENGLLGDLVKVGSLHDLKSAIVHNLFFHRKYSFYTRAKYTAEHACKEYLETIRKLL